MTARIAIITDSTTDFPADLVEKHHVYVAPLHVLWGADDLLDGIDITPLQFYERLRTDPVLPTTSQPTPAAFAELYQRAMDETGAEGVLALTISADLSGTYSSAMQARDMMDFPVQVVDLRTASVATALPLMKVLAAREEGASLDEAASLAQSLAGRSELVFSVDTLEYLHKGGRIGGAQRLLGTAFNIKPILHVEEGKVEAFESVRTRKRVLNRLVEIFDDLVDPSKPVSFGVLHSAAPEDAQRLEAALKERCQPEHFVMTQIGPVVGVHVGPKAVGFAMMQ